MFSAYAVSTVPISEPNAYLATTTSKVDLTCFSSGDGIVIANASGGTPTYKYLWTQGLDTQATDTAIGLFAGMVTLELIDNNNCTIANDTLYLTEPSEVLIELSSTDTICIGDSIAINATASGGNGGPFTFNLLPFDTVSPPIYVKPVETKTYGMRSIDQRGCESAVEIVTVYVKDLLSDTMDVLSSGDICLGDTVAILGVHNGIYLDYSYSWNYASNILNFQDSPVDSRYYTLTITNGCGQSIKDSVFVNVFPLPNLSLDPIVDEGCASLTVQFKNLTNDSNITSYSWDLGDGSTSSAPEPIYTYSFPGKYEINLTVENSFGCVDENDSASNYVIVYALPQVFFTSNPSFTDMRNPIVTFTSTSSDGQHDWNFGDLGISTERNPIHNYGDTGEYIVTLIVVMKMDVRTQLLTEFW